MVVARQVGLIDPGETIMTSVDRRTFLAGTAAAGLSLAADSPQVAAANRVARPKKPRIKIGQIGTGHAHARGVFAQLKQVTEDFELVGIVGYYGMVSLVLNAFRVPAPDNAMLLS